MYAYTYVANPYNKSVQHVCRYSYQYTEYKHLAMPNIEITLLI